MLTSAGRIMLEIRELHVRYGSIVAVRGVDIQVNRGEIVALIGANGAGKTTIVRAIAGLLPYRGDMHFEGERLKLNNAEGNLRLGIALVPEGRGILAKMTVQENLLMGIYSRRDKNAAAEDLKKMEGRFPILRERRSQIAGLLSGGEQQMLAIARALLARPRLLLLDEPSLGLAPKLTDAIFETVIELRAGGLTVLLVEQKARQTLKIADRAYLLETGRVLTEGRATDLGHDERVSDAFLGAASQAQQRQWRS